jgi:23S rRNA (uracil1939-C5)-methyltransferase
MKKELDVEQLGINGEGVARSEGLTFFVDGALPQERVEAEIYEQRKSFARARMLKRFEDSPHRTTPLCPLFGRCGGCQLMHLSYEQQLIAKRQRVVDALERIGKLTVPVAACHPSPQTIAYRNKIQLPVNAQRRLGLYAFNTHELVEIDTCPIHCSLGEQAMQCVQQCLLTYPKPLALRHVLIKTAVHTGQVLVILVTQDKQRLTSLGEQIVQALPAIKGVVQTINTASGNTILGKTFDILAGQGWIEEVLCGLTFKVSSASFFQVNPAQAEMLYQKVLNLAQLTGEETVLDAYCGVGTLSLILAGQAKSVIGIEATTAAILDAQDNAERNHVRNARFITGLVEEEIASIGSIDVAILNPPRKGCTRGFLDCLIEKQPKRIIYVSCDPATLARDLSILEQRGYQVCTAEPLDMFPQTMHVEVIVSLTYL